MHPVIKLQLFDNNKDRFKICRSIFILKLKVTLNIKIYENQFIKLTVFQDN